MFKSISTFLTIITTTLYMGILFILPFQWHKFGPYSEIFPAFDLIIIYYLSTYHNMQYWHLFIAGIFIDQLYNFPMGISSLTFILSYHGLNLLSRWFLLKHYLTNVVIFSIYSLFIIISRYLIVTIKSTHYIEGISVLFYFLTTIFAYPIMFIMLDKPMKILGKYVR